MALLTCVLIGQAVWVNKIREVKINKYHQIVTFVLSKVVNDFLDSEYVDLRYHFRCGLKSNEDIFRWKEMSKTTEFSSFREFYEMMKLVSYDHLYQNNLLKLEKIDSIYRQHLQACGILELPVLSLYDNSTGQILMSTDSPNSFEGELFTRPVNVSYKYKHQIVAAFREPLIWHSMIWHLVWEGIFLAGFILCLVWQWRAMRMTWRSTKIQTMGIAHLEHELKKPLATMISAVRGIIDRENRELTETQELKLKLIKTRLLKMADMIHAMLTALKTSEFKIERIFVDIRQEMKLIAEMFVELQPHAKVVFQIKEDIESPLLDQVYFNCVVMNLVDNAIKYGGEQPEVNVQFGREGEHWVLAVTDHGIGMSTKALKRIFQQFYRVKDKRVAATTGFGLGLAFVKKVVNAYGGEIRVESELGKGSKFVILIKRD